MKKKNALKQKVAPKRAAIRPTETAPAKKPQPKAARPVPRKMTVAETATQFELLKAAVPRLVASKTRRGQPAAEFASFEDAKDRAIDFLIDFIADCEQQLWDLKRAESYEAYAALLEATERLKL